MNEVIIRKSEYKYPSLRQSVFEIMDSLAGEQIQRKSRVIIKPNLLASASPDRAVLTHPLVVRAVVEYVLDRGAAPQISDSSAVGSFDRVLKDSGIKEALSGLKVSYKEFKESSIVDVGEPFKKIEIASDALNADVLINLPKLKTHMQMVLTLGVKNLFGCIVGMKKAEWHFRTGVNREMFAQLLVKIYQAVSPSINLIDGILAMEGQGPGKRGEPRHLGVLMGSKNAAAIDVTVCRMLGVSPDTLLTNKFAVEQGLVSNHIIVDGKLPRITDFKLPEITPLVFGPRKFHGVLRRHLVQRPECDDSLCRLCGECWKYCPARAINHSGEKVHFDYDKCIRCYCCIEVCPHAALSARETLAGKLTRKMLKMKD